MKLRYLAAGLLLVILTAFGLAHAQSNKAPGCWLVTGNAKGYTVGATDGAAYAAWWCPDGWGDYGPQPVMVVLQHGIPLRRPQGTLTADATPAELAVAYWHENVGFSCVNPPADWALQACTAAYNAANRTRPLPEYVVRPNGAQATRPTYPLVNGTRGTTSNGRVNVLSPGGRPIACNPAQRVGDYMQVKRTPGTVALCTKSEG